MYNAVDDFDGSGQTYTFSAGLVQDQPVTFQGSGLATPDSKPEFTEGFLLYLDIDESSLDARDRERLTAGRIRVINPLVLVLIKGNDRECCSLCAYKHRYGFPWVIFYRFYMKQYFIVLFLPIHSKKNFF